jgi:Tol biopolymer transport system component
MGRSLGSGQVAELTVIDVDGSDRHVVFTADEVIEAPNWTPDGRWLVFNAGGELWRVGPDGGSAPERIETGSIRQLNNDHVLSPDGKSVYVSNNDMHLYVLPIEGGTPRRVSNTHPNRFQYYLHGVSPDGATLVYTGAATLPDGSRTFNIYTIPVAGGPDVQLTDSPGTNDGPEYSPDGEWIWFNSEMAGLGHAQIFKMRPDGSEKKQVTFDARVNWFPHFSPDGKSIIYLSYPEGTQGHPADKDVILRFMHPDGTGRRDVVAFFGGQGTINVNSWAPDNRRFAYVAYPVKG